jgi:hypothetical protein
MATLKRRHRDEPGRYVMLKLPVELEEKLSEDARRCRRSKSAQVEAILVEFYAIDSTRIKKSWEDESLER